MTNEQFEAIVKRLDMIIDLHTKELEICYVAMERNEKMLEERKAEKESDTEKYIKDLTTSLSSVSAHVDILIKTLDFLTKKENG